MEPEHGPPLEEEILFGKHDLLAGFTQQCTIVL